MSDSDAAFWSDLLRRTLALYDEPLLRQVLTRLVKPRNQWPIEELIDRGMGTATNPAVLDRRLQELEPASRQALALMGHSRQPFWKLGSLIEMLMVLGHADGLKPLFTLLEAGLLYPRLAAAFQPEDRRDKPGGSPARLKTFEQWLAYPGPSGLTVFTHPQIAERAVGEPLGLPDLTRPPAAVPEDRRDKPGGSPAADEAEPAPVPEVNLTPHGTPQEADGLEWLLRLAVLWQQVAAAPLRRTQQGGFFKRDLERLQADPLLNSPPADRLVDVPDLGFLVAALAERQGLVRVADGELGAGDLPAAWESGLSASLEALWIELPRLSDWNSLEGWNRGESSTATPFASAYLLSFLLLAQLPDQAWMSPALLQSWLMQRHPYWPGESVRPSWLEPWLETFLLGVAYHLRLVQAVRSVDGGWLVRLTPAARWLLRIGAQAGERGNPPAQDAVFSQTLLVQPNLEIIAYRQGLTTSLILKLTRFATWKSLGAACTLQLEPETVYRALEAGQTFETIRLTLEQHGTRVVPPAVLDSLRTWSNKRERITVYPSATLLEFASGEDLTEALARGLPGVRIADTLAVVASEEEIDFRHFRLTGTRDYSLPPERCVRLEDDGVTLTVDLSRSDLLLETELPRFAEQGGGSAASGQRQYRLTPASLASARSGGMQLSTLEAWFQQRCGQPLSPAARMLFIGSQLPPPRLEQKLVLEVASPELADGLLQWPETRALVSGRLGPTALLVSEEQAPLLRERLRAAGLPSPGPEPLQ